MPRRALVVLSILVSTAFLLLFIALGGVVPEQIIALVLGMMCYAFCLSQIGLFSSTISRSSRRATSFTCVLWVILEFAGGFLTLLSVGCGEWGFFRIKQLLDAASEFLWQRSMWSASSEFLMYERGESLWHVQMTFHLCVGLGFLGLSWLLFEPMNQASLAHGASASENNTRGFAIRTRGLRSLRCWDAAIIWKSWQFLVGGWRWISAMTIAMPLLSIGLVLGISTLVDERADASLYGVTLMFVGGASFVILRARLFGNVLKQEIHHQTLVSLCMLPRRRSEVLTELYLGLLPGLLAPLVCFGLGFIWVGAIQHDFLTGFVSDVIVAPWFWAMLGWLVVTVHIGTLLSVYLRHGSMLIAIAVCYFAIPFMSSMVLGVFGMFLGGPGAGVGGVFMLYVLPLGLIAGETAAIFFIHWLILQRVENLAAK